MRRALLAAALCSVLVVIGRPVAADCGGPTIEITQREVAPGDVVTGWGDNCYDANDPPPGEGVLGVPIDGIEIYIVQGDSEWLVANGSADVNYAFEVTVVAPVELTPGEAEVQARLAEGVAYIPDSRFVVIDAPPPSVVDTTVVTFGPTAATTLEPTTPPPVTVSPDESAATTSTSPAVAGTSQSTAVSTTTGEQDAGDGSGATATLIVVGVAVLLLALGAGAMWARSRRD
jgi:hypothetical protein